MRVDIEVEDKVRHGVLADLRVHGSVHVKRRLSRLCRLLGLLNLLLELGVVLLEELLDLELVLVAYQRVDQLQVAASLGLALLTLDHEQTTFLFLLLGDLLLQGSFGLALVFTASNAGPLGCKVCS